MKKLLKTFSTNILLPILEPLITSLFHIIYYHSQNTWLKNKFLGFEILQCPFDLHNYQELIYKLQPNFIIQTGIAGGGSLFFFAKLLDMMELPSEAIVIGIDILITNEAKKLDHPRIHIIEGSSISEEVILEINKLTFNRKGIVVLDSDHSKNHVFAEMMLYKDYVEAGSYLVVEDTNVNGHPVSPFFGDGPLEAVNDFLKISKDFIRDDQLWKRNKFSFHQRGWLKKI